MASDRAFDDTRAPELDLIDDCVHCGFCLETCPTYVLWNEEMDSPRGRIVLMREGLEPQSELSDQMVAHFDACLGCMACVTACPSGVQYDKLIEDTRAQVERNYPRSVRERLYRAGLFALFTHPGRLRVLAPLLVFANRSGLMRLLRRSGLLERFPRLRALAELSPSVGVSETLKHLPQTVSAQGRRRGKVGLLQGCVARVYFHQVNAAAVNVLSKEGFDVFAPRLPRCCGALMLHTGYDARALAKQTIAAFEDCDHIVTTAAGCGSALKDYAHLFRDDPEWYERASAFANKVRDVSELLAEFAPQSKRNPVDMVVAYHDACHLAHAQKVTSQPRALLSAIPQLEVREPREPELCCGSAGVYNLLQPGPAGELGRRKAQNLLDTQVEAVVAGNPGCALQIEAKSKELGKPLRVYHPLELLNMSLEGV